MNPYIIHVMLWRIRHALQVTDTKHKNFLLDAISENVTYLPKLKYKLTIPKSLIFY